MKTVKKLSLLVLVIATLTVSVNAALTPPRQIEENSYAGIAVKAKFVNGVLMPVVDLPLVEIIGLKPGKVLVKGVIRNGEVVAISNLPEIEITAERVIYPENLNGIDSDIISNNDLPIIEITTYFPVELLHLAIINDSTPILVIELPEFEVISSKLSNDFITKPWVTYLQFEEAGKEINIAGFQPNSITYTSKHSPRHQFVQGALFISTSNCIISDSKHLLCKVIMEMIRY